MPIRADVGGPLSGPLTAMLDAAGEFAARAHDEAAMVAGWLVTAGGARTTAETDALSSAFGEVGTRDTTPPAEFLTAHDAALPQLLAGAAHLQAWRYYLAVMELAHTTVALSLYPTAAALAYLDRLRTVLLSAIDTAGARPGASTARAHVVETSPSVPPSATYLADEVENLLADLDELIGLDPVKSEVRRVADRLLIDRLRRDRGLPVPETSRHLVFSGNPGTGKTTVARLIGQIYAAMGVVAHGRLVETGREGLVAGFVGQTATRVTERFDEADGGLLLIDEAYSLLRGGERDFGREAIDTLVKLSEDRRDRVVVILAGYPDEVDALLAINPGMTSRFPKVVHFPDYSTDELVDIATGIAQRSGYQLTAAARIQLHAQLDGAERTRGFGNGRVARNLIEAAIDRQASRVADAVRRGEEPSPLILSRLRKADLTPPSDPNATRSERLRLIQPTGETP